MTTINNQAKKHLELINQFNNIIELIKTVDTDEQIKMLKGLDTLDTENMMNDFNELIIKENKELKVEVEKLKAEIIEKTPIECEKFVDCCKCKEKFCFRCESCFVIDVWHDDTVDYCCTECIICDDSIAVCLDTKDYIINKDDIYLCSTCEKAHYGSKMTCQILEDEMKQELKCLTCK